MEKKKRISGLGIQVALSIVCIILGALLLLSSEINVTTLSVVFCVALLFAGAASLFIFFFTGAYRRMNDYSFAAGVLMLILGVCGLVRIDVVAASFYAYSGIVALVLGVMMLQTAVSLTVLGSRLSIMQFVFAGIVLACSVIIIDNVELILAPIPVFPEITLLVSGALSIIGLCVNWFATRSEKTEDETAAEE
ncbi:MAG: DUF308 domain-containing protein [Oscillospiraceae bacterium]|nr:DUF308 domain-containing protein [Oscillospiraceae bacterium]